jgi:hypothetical protein
MTLKRIIADAVFGHLWEATHRAPDVVIGSRANPYLLRWHIIPRNRFLNVYFHLFLRSDDDRALHCHPWINLSFLLRGVYTEHTIRAGGVHAKVRREAGDLKLRRATAAHRIELTDGPCWTLFVTGPKVREWGFHHAKCGWVHWKDFTREDEFGSSVYNEEGCDAA